MMKIKFSYLVAFLVISFALLAACTKAPAAEKPSVTAPTPEKEVTVGQMYITKYTATKSGSTATVLVGLKNLNSTLTSGAITVTLFYSKQPVATKTVNVILLPNEKKDIMVKFENYPDFVGFTVTGPALINPAR